MISVVGLGFVGLTTALGFASKGIKVLGIDSNLERLEMLSNNQLPFHEPQLDSELASHLNQRFFLKNSVQDTNNQSQLFFICVGTPSLPDGSADLSQIQSVIKAILAAKKSDDVVTIVVKSTVPPSSTETLATWVSQQQQGKNKIRLLNNPEFLREGYAWEDFIQPDRIVIGSKKEADADELKAIYQNFKAPIHVVSWTCAEFIKYLSNSFLATMISYSNEMALIAKQFEDIDIAKSFEILHQDKRWNGHPAPMKNYVYPGIGYGGYCLPKDTQALIKAAEARHYQPDLLRNVDLMNDKVKTQLLDDFCSKVPVDSKVAILGLAFKPNSDDVRLSPSAEFIRRLLDKGYQRLMAHDPLAIESFKSLYDFNIEYQTSLQDIVGDADTIIILTAWDEYLPIIKQTDKPVFNYRYMS